MVLSLTVVKMFGDNSLIPVYGLNMRQTLNKIPVAKKKFYMAEEVVF